MTTVRAILNNQNKENQGKVACTAQTYQEEKKSGRKGNEMPIPSINQTRGQENPTTLLSKPLYQRLYLKFMKKKQNRERMKKTLITFAFLNDPLYPLDN